MFKITIRLFFVLVLFVFVSHSSLFAQKTRNVKADTKNNETAVYQPSQLEQEVLTEINNLRQNPGNYAKFLKNLRDSIEDNVLQLPDGRRLRLNEGAKAFDNAISDLKKRGKLRPLSFSSGLSKVARTQMSDLRENTRLGHFGRDGSDLEIRLLRIGVPGKEQAENISYNSRTALQIVLNMVLDENVSGRPHRENLLSNRFDQIGVSYGVSKNQVGICVLVFNNNFRESTKKTRAIPVL